MLKPIPGFYKTIWISSKTGTVYNLLRGFTALKIGLDTWGYPCVKIPCFLRDSIEAQIHMLLGETFIPKRTDRPDANTINHMNTLKADYDLSNLEWTTKAANTSHAIFMGCNEYHLFKDSFNEDGRYIPFNPKTEINKNGTRKLRYNEKEGYINRVRRIDKVSAVQWEESGLKGEEREICDKVPRPVTLRYF